MEDVENLIMELEYYKKRREEIQSILNFEVCNYVLDEIIYGEYCSNNDNIVSLIKLAILQKRMTKKQGEIITREINKIKNNKID